MPELKFTQTRQIKLYYYEIIIAYNKNNFFILLKKKKKKFNRERAIIDELLGAITLSLRSEFLLLANNGIKWRKKSENKKGKTKALAACTNDSIILT